MVMKLALVGSMITFAVAIVIGFIVANILLSRVSTRILSTETNSTFIKKE